jgi:hypothetical protein
VSQASTPEERAPEYDEFAFLETYANHEGIPWNGRPAVHRESASAGDIRLSGLVWGTGSPELIFLHGGGQNAHTWDSVAMVLNRPLIAMTCRDTVTPTGGRTRTTTPPATRPRWASGSSSCRRSRGCWSACRWAG